MRTRSKVVSWHRPLAFPIKLRDGHVIETMAQAAGPEKNQRPAVVALDDEAYAYRLRLAPRNAAFTV